MQEFYLGTQLWEKSRYADAEAHLHQGLSNNMKIRVVRKPGLADRLLPPASCFLPSARQRDMAMFIQP